MGTFYGPPLNDLQESNRESPHVCHMCILPEKSSDEELIVVP